MKIKRIIIILITIMIFLGIYSTYIERRLLTVKEHKVVLKQNGKDNIKVVQFTDTQLGEFYSLEQLGKVVDKINSIDADVVVFTGDLIDNASKYEHIQEVAKVLAKINPKAYKYAIYGNHDYGGGAVRYYGDIMKEAGFKVLKNENVTINVRDAHINIFGADDGLIGDYNYKKTVKGISDKDINILLLHEPDLIKDFLDYPIDLALSGHSHGGQVYIPFYGPVSNNCLSEKYNRGIYNLENKRNTSLYVNTGLGNTKVPFRFLNVPEVSVFDIIF